MKLRNKLFLLVIVTFLSIFLWTVKSYAGDLYLNDLEYQVQINENGSMDVTEIWNIDIEETNTLYKSFKKDETKYSNITNVKVKEITNGTENEFLKSDEWAYHVNKGYYYGTENEDDDFEIGWGVGLDHSSGVRKYEISYTVNDAILKCNDCAELYWQFVGGDFEVDAKKIKGIILLPSRVNNIDEIKVWGHTEGLNGTIYATDTNKIEFEVNSFRHGRFVEIRTLFPTELISYSGRIKNINILDKAITEETMWANEANARRQRKEYETKVIMTVFVIGVILLNIVLTIVYIRKMRKYIAKKKTLVKFKPTQKFEYFREIPDENITPCQAYKIDNIKLGDFNAYNFGNLFSATVLDLTLKKYIEINQDGKKKFTFKILKPADDNLNLDEKYIFNFLIKAVKKDDMVTLNELESYIKNHPSAVETLLKKSTENTNSELASKKLIDKELQKEYSNYITYEVCYVIFGMISLLCTMFLLAIPAIIFFIDAFLCSRIANNLNVLTQEGVDQKEQWKGLKKFMKEFSLLDKREVPELVLWEKYLVYATVFGIADKVIKQLKIVYPNFDEMTSQMNTFTCMHLMTNTNFSSSFSHAMTSSFSSAYSSGSGSGGGFSGGGGFGGGRRRRRPEDKKTIERNDINGKTSSSNNW